jgi:hypothetical protein
LIISSVSRKRFQNLNFAHFHAEAFVYHFSGCG